jgi:hypothetical protein
MMKIMGGAQHSSMARHMERGQAAPFLAMGIFALYTVMALALDVSLWRDDQRHEQMAADSAAIAGVVEEKTSTQLSNIQSAARTDATLNGFTDNGSTLTVTVNNPPSSGSFTGNATAVEVVVKKKYNSLFSRAYGSAFQWVTARAVALRTKPSRTCILALSPSSYALTINGATVNIPTCGTMSDASETINGSTVNAASIGYASNSPPAVDNGSTYGNATPALASSVSDPCSTIPGCAGLQAATLGGSCQATTLYNGLGTASIPPGRYCSQLIVNGCTNVTFQSGFYEFDAGVTLNGASNVTGTDVTFYNKAGQAVINGSTVSLAATSTGSYEGMLFYQPSSNTNGFTVNGSGAGFQGGAYAPAAAVTINGVISKWALVIGSTITINGSGVNVADSSFPGIVGAALAE